MNPFDKINQLKDVLRNKAKGVKGEDTISQFEHYKEMLNLLTILSEELKTAEYNYHIENLDEKTYHTFEEMTFTQEHLTDDILLVQPAAIDSVLDIDMTSLCNVLQELKDSDRIKEDIVVIPPSINVFKAKLALPASEPKSENEE